MNVRGFWIRAIWKDSAFKREETVDVLPEQPVEPIVKERWIIGRGWSQAWLEALTVKPQNGVTLHRVEYTYYDAASEKFLPLFLEIDANGSKWYGEQLCSVWDLLDTLQHYPLDRQYAEHFDGGVQDYECEAFPGAKMFTGRFHAVSHTFRITSNDPDVIERLTKAIELNQKRPDYLSQPPKETAPIA